MKTPVALLVVLTFISCAVPSVRADVSDWSLMDTQGETFRLSAIGGSSPVLLLFWATWCAPCKKELNDHKELFDSFTEKGVTVLLVSEDTQRTQSKVKPYVESKGYSWQCLLDTNGEVLKRYGGTSLPYTVLLDNAGNPVQKIRGAVRDAKTLSAQIDELLGAHGE